MKKCKKCKNCQNFKNGDVIFTNKDGKCSDCGGSIPFPIYTEKQRIIEEINDYFKGLIYVPNPQLLKDNIIKIINK